MTAKAAEPRTLMKVPVSFRNQMRQRAQRNGTNMLVEIVKLVEHDAGGSRQAITPTADTVKERAV